MGYDLPALRSAVDHQAVPLFVNPLLSCQLICHCHHMPHQRDVFPGEVGKGFDMFLSHDEKMYRCLRVDIGEGDHALILIDDIAFDLAVYYAAENTIHLVFSKPVVIVSEAGDNATSQESDEIVSQSLSQAP